MRSKNKNFDIAIVIPAYNESKRLSVFLPTVIAYCGRSARHYQIIIVDDASTDNTFEIAAAFKKDYAHLDVIRISKNRGKGYAVKKGLLRAEAEVCVFFDADGSVEPQEIDKNIHYILNEGYDIFIGSRVTKGEGCRLKVKMYRKFIGIVFNFFVHFFLFKNFKDTQCGFKMFRGPILKPLFSRSHIRGFGFDMEILYVASKMGYRVKEGPVSWHHVSGSKINLFIDSLGMLINILQIRNWHCIPINPLWAYLGPDEYEHMFNMEQHHWWFVSRRNLVFDLIKRYSGSSVKILDVGAGTGANLLEFGKLGEVFGVDPSEKAVKFCLQRGIKHIYRSLGEELPFKDQTFDIITCLDVLEHIPNAEDILVELRRVLKDNGKIIFTVPAFNALWSRHDEALCHLRRYCKNSFFDELNDAKLKADQASYFFLITFFVIALIRIVGKFFHKKVLQSDTGTLPSKFINSALIFYFKIEAKVAIRFGLAFGTSLYAVVSKDK